MVDLNSMTIFVCAVEMNSFSQAARKLGIPKATVSRKVAGDRQQSRVQASRTYPAQF
ncbi:MAG: LysR family transcriptional regulator [Leptolyngbyaceae cyanobacterium SL_5_9]|nr:LysR family transcriptional regulator [Leptolyngbyaceae cyanobacterium SL_5_9]NJO75693.1 LysR family transcriptional regulator [Leptolyngbyaceae cyanobacterium RM1_406_9]